MLIHTLQKQTKLQLFFYYNTTKKRPCGCKISISINQILSDEWRHSYAQRNKTTLSLTVLQETEKWSPEMNTKIAM